MGSPPRAHTSPAGSSPGDLPTSPRHGDVVVEHHDDGSFTLHRHPEKAQLRCSSRDEAVRLGEQFAELRHVDLWEREGPGMSLLAMRRLRSRHPAF